jgi:Ca2+-binding RTX toxin-like protein
VSGTGEEFMFGDAVFREPGVATGRDIFVFGRGSGADQIFDFEQGKDKIDVSAYGFTSFEELTIDPVGRNVVIFEGDASFVRVNGYVDGQILLDIVLAPGDFIFAA